MNVKIPEKWAPHSARPAGVVVDTVVLHCTAHQPGSRFESVVSFMVRSGETAKPVSYHLLVDVDGSAVKLVPFGQKAFHAGNSYGPHEEAQSISRRQNSRSEFTSRPSVNPYSVGLSLFNTNLGVDRYTAAQMASLEEAVRSLKGQFKALRWVCTHAEISPGRKTDPVRFPIDQFAAKVGLSAWRYGG